ncbi:dTDP-4-dehydrorhamnose reductase [candidate division KSB1 bacterium]|nr:dTDP-4-dehydrorhamnose reductase [candidate division KSB1 bacterium]
MVEKIFITGCNGLLGQKLVTQLHKTYYVAGGDLHQTSLLGADPFEYHPMDIAQRTEMNRRLQEFKPDIIINAAAYTNVDKAETERELCWQVNVHGVENLVYSAQKINAKLIHISTDYVFDGNSGPYRETDRPAANGFYARSKLASENVLNGSGLNFVIIRTMILFGVGTGLRPDFVAWLIDALRSEKPVTIVDDQIGNPTLADDLANAIENAIQQNASGLYHISGSERIDRFHFALRIADTFELNKALIKAIKTSELKQAAPRPLNSGFTLDKARHELGIQMRDIQSALLEYKRQLEQRSKS